MLFFALVTTEGVIELLEVSEVQFFMPNQMHINLVVVSCSKIVLGYLLKYPWSLGLQAALLLI